MAALARSGSAATRSNAEGSAKSQWTVYLLRCADDTLYCGITNDLPARLAAHTAGKGAKYTRGRGPLQVVATQRTRDKRVALRIEHAVKRLPRTEKLALDPDRLQRIAAAQRRRLRAILTG